MEIGLKRIYEPPDPRDGLRILVERLWPRGLSKAEAAVDYWAKEVAPTPELRRWFGHRPERWQAFRRSYLDELDGKPAALAHLRQQCTAGPVIFVFAARHKIQNGAVVLRSYLLSTSRGLEL